MDNANFDAFDAIDILRDLLEAVLSSETDRTIIAVGISIGSAYFLMRQGDALNDETLKRQAQNDMHEAFKNLFSEIKLDNETIDRLIDVLEESKTDG